jgi:biopolymer transport protein ExbB
MYIRALLTAVCLLIPAISQAWWSDDWNFRKELTINATAAAQNLPVLVRLHTGNFSYFHDLKADGADLRFVAGDDKTPLKFHIEKFDVTNEMALVWVQLPQVKAGQKFWMYYGNAAAEPATDMPGTYDESQALVYHFEVQGVPRDATSYDHQPTQFTAQPNPASLIGAGLQLSANTLLQVPVTGVMAIDPAKGWTFSSWVKLEGSQKDANVMQLSSLLTLGVDGTNPYARYGTQTAHGAPLTAGEWHHLAVTVGKDHVVLYIDGKEAGNVAATIVPTSGLMVIGAGSAGDHFLKGELDEVQVSAIARPAEWIALAAEGQGTNTNFVALGSDEEKDGKSESTSYFGVILQNVTLDGWVVIGILAIMAVISWLIMIAKGWVLTRMHRDNQAFLADFRRLGLENQQVLDTATSEEERDLEDAPFLAALFGKHDHYQSSPLYHIYQTGIHEIQNRFARTVGAQASGLTPQAIVAIRAALDASLVHESQKQNAQMVLLTIAISGGPFLGLLGTVVGVMITFAAIAASGDVNINAIAPGIAAALVATVAGLAVAIPALFGYNYLGSRIRDNIAQMQVFVDEFIGKIAEHHGN